MIKTEMRNPETMNLDKMSTREIVSVITKESYNAIKAVEEAEDSIVIACDIITKTIKNGGRLIYIGAGTSGRLGVLDASECPPTFGVSSDVVVGVIAGGDKCLRTPSENAEDRKEAGVIDVQNVKLSKDDVLVGISVAGNAQYVLGAVEYAKSIGAKTIGISSNSELLLGKSVDAFVFTDTGAEVVTGSTRMKAGTAQKTILNIFTTTAMVQNGYVYENLMINLKPSNTKLTERVKRIVCEILKCSETEAVKLLDKNDWNIRKAVESVKNNGNIK